MNPLFGKKEDEYYQEKENPYAPYPRYMGRRAGMPGQQPAGQQGQGAGSTGQQPGGQVYPGQGAAGQPGRDADITGQQQTDSQIPTVGPGIRLKTVKGFMLAGGLACIGFGPFAPLGLVLHITGSLLYYSGVNRGKNGRAWAGFVMIMATFFLGAVIGAFVIIALLRWV